MTVRILAEPGSTAEGDLRRFRLLIDVAAHAGATAFKNQWTSSPARMCERRHAPDYLAAYRRIAYPDTYHLILSAWCKDQGLDYGCAVYLPEDVAVIAPFVDFFKVSSFECQDAALVIAMASYGKPVIISTGMLGRADRVPISPRAEYLHCVSAYPAPVEQINLAVLWQRRVDGSPVYAGLSDHTRNILTGAFAVCAGAEILEVHYRLEDTDPSNPDYAVAFTPEELRAYIDGVRLAEMMLGDGVKKPQPAEAKMRQYRIAP